jgi:hypothetical protein
MGKQDQIQNLEDYEHDIETAENPEDRAMSRLQRLGAMLEVLPDLKDRNH